MGGCDGNTYANGRMTGIRIGVAITTAYRSKDLNANRRPRFTNALATTSAAVPGAKGIRATLLVAFAQRRTVTRTFVENIHPGVACFAGISIGPVVAATNRIKNSRTDFGLRDTASGTSTVIDHALAILIRSTILVYQAFARRTFTRARCGNTDPRLGCFAGIPIGYVIAATDRIENFRTS